MSNAYTADYRNGRRSWVVAAVVVLAGSASFATSARAGELPAPAVAPPAYATAPPASGAASAPAADADARATPEPGATIDAVVERLVAEALAANLELEGSDAAVARRLAALDEARARYLPALDLNARYSRADGGRTISFPVGDLLNPVYATLNQLTGQARFPAIENAEIAFLREREQETKVSLTQPLYDARLGAARDAAAAQLVGSEANRAALRGRVARDVRQAYYRWLQARAQVGILDATLELARENLRVNDSLFRNGKVTRDLVFRAEADVLEVEQQRLAAANGVRLARSYVNLLRAAPFDRELPVAAVADPDVARLRDGLAARTGGAAQELAGLQDVAVERRAELRELEAAGAAAAAGERLARAAFRPQLALAVDAGTQGEDYERFTWRDDGFVLASVVLRFNLYAGGGDRARVRGARAQQAELRATRALAERQVRLEVEEALSNLEVAQASLDTANKRVEAAAGAFRIAARKRDLGQINQAEFVDARRVLTDAQLNLNVTRFEALDGLAQLEYAVGAADRPGAAP
jgi:outer membrane protein TolC